MVSSPSCSAITRPSLAASYGLLQQRQEIGKTFVHHASISPHPTLDEIFTSTSRRIDPRLPNVLRSDAHGVTSVCALRFQAHLGVHNDIHPLQARRTFPAVCRRTPARSGSYLAGCDSDSGDNAELRVIHGSPDAPAVNAKLNGSEAVSDLDYAESTGYVRVDPAVYEITVEGIIPGGNADVITVPGRHAGDQLAHHRRGRQQVAEIEPLVVADSAAIPGPMRSPWAVLHASTAADAATNTGGAIRVSTFT